ncbi:pentapeptide repeat-containing protein [Caballeronia zhejiangensis]|uniref:pentapeptide repeat-containing protein n=1 Tax=Caballeronia zhejiangensis TaxID=871203 RepID=UPI001FC937B1
MNFRIVLCALRNCTITQCGLIKNDWTDVTLGGVKLISSTVDHLRAKSLHIYDTALTGAIFFEATMNGSTWHAVSGRHCQFFRCELTESVWRSVSLPHASFKGAQLRHASFTECCMLGTDFSNIAAHHAVFYGSDISGSNFSHADLTNCTFTKNCADGVRVHGAMVGQLNHDATWRNVIPTDERLLASERFDPTR